MKTIFQIRDLSCAYNTGKTVLHIPELDIPQGELVFLLGVSGSGKSTLLETLALMNNTIASGEVHFDGNDNNSFKFSELWRKNKPEAIAQVRKKHFSFIFQDTNLMENFTAYENICLAQMIKQNVRQDEAMTDARQLANQVGLTETELNTNTLAVNLSGGQRQRLAFIRAINNKFSVIFGDEPTGNLDEANANELLHILKQNLHNTSSAIVVSHDIDLAVRHADRIIVITKSPEGHGEILPQNIYVAQAWRDTPDTFRQQLADLYKSPTTNLPPQNTAPVTTANPTYASLFFEKEGKALTGKRRINFWILTTMLTLTFMAIGFANGSLDYLNKKMNNAFVKWMSITVPWRESDNAENIRLRLSDPELAGEFEYENVSAYVQYPLRFWKKTDDTNTERVKGRSVKFDTQNKNPLVSELLRGKNLLYGDTAMLGNTDLSLIVTKRFLNRLDMPPDATFVDMEYTVNDIASAEPINLRVPIPIRAVVEEIPGRNLLTYTLNFYETHGEKIEGAFDIRQHRDIHLFVPGKLENAEKTLDAIKQFFRENVQYKSEEPNYRITGKHDMSHAEGHDIEITFYTILRSAKTDEIWAKIQASPLFADAPKDIKRIYRYDAARVRDDISYDRISLYFNNLSKIRPFADTLYRNPERMGARNPIEVDIAQIKEKENFNFLSKITKIIAWLLVGFGATSISLFLFNLLKMHLSKVKMKIGTLKAFGLGNGEAQGIYFRIILQFLVFSIVLSLLIAALSGYAADLMLADRIVGEAETSYFNLIHPNTLITLIILIVVTIFVSLYTIRTMLSKSPGDLIYNR